MDSKISAVEFELPGHFSLSRKIRPVAAKKRRTNKPIREKVEIEVVAFFDECPGEEQLSLEVVDYRKLMDRLRSRLAKYDLTLDSLADFSNRTRHATSNGECRLEMKVELTLT